MLLVRVFFLVLMSCVCGAKPVCKNNLTIGLQFFGEELLVNSALRVTSEQANYTYMALVTR